MSDNLPTVEVSVIETIERLATNPDVDVSKIKAFLEMQEHLLDRRNREEFNRAMVRAQNKIQPIIKDTPIPKKGKYPKLDKVIRESEPIYSAEGFSLMFYEGESHKENHVRVMCDIMHSSGHVKTVYVNMAVSTKGGKGTEFMTEIDAEASAFTKGRRYLICMIFNIPTPDDDGENAGGIIGDPISEAQMKTLSNTIKAKGADAEKFLKYFEIETLSEMPEKRFKEAMAMLRDKK